MRAAGFGGCYFLDPVLDLLSFGGFIALLFSMGIVVPVLGVAYLVSKWRASR